MTEILKDASVASHTLGLSLWLLVDFYNKQQIFCSPIGIICLDFVTEKYCVYSEVGIAFLYYM
jgi:hypothetical protein